nr:hypothetical protein [Stenotrophomonas sp. Marseille-Q4652]
MRQQQMAQLNMPLRCGQHQQRPPMLIPGLGTAATIEMGLHKLDAALRDRKAQKGPDDRLG